MIDDDYHISAERFDFGSVVGRTFSVIARNFMPFFLVALLLEGLPTFLTNAIPLMRLSEIAGVSDFFNILPNGDLEAGKIALFIVGGIIAITLYFLAYMTLQGTIIHACLRDFKGKDIDMRESLSIGWRFVWPLIGFAILSTLGMSLGFLLLIVPGIILACMWMVGTVAIVSEGGGVFNAFARSAELTRGYKWWIFLAFIIYSIVIIILALVGELLTIPLGMGELGIMTGVETGTLGAILYSLIQALVAVATVLLTAAGVASLYYELCIVKEGEFPDALATVFD